MSSPALIGTSAGTTKSALKVIPNTHKQDIEHVDPSTPGRKKRKVRRQKIEDELDFGRVAGVAIITLSPLAQKCIGCVLDEDITTEKPWMYIPKHKIDDNLELHDKSSEFLPIKTELAKLNKPEVLLGYVVQATANVDAFYVCLTEEAETEVCRIIELRQKQQEERMHNAVHRSIGRWRSLGSEKDINLAMPVCNRLLLEVELESKYPVLSDNVKFRYRFVNNAIDGYTEILADSRKEYANVTMKNIDAATQVTPFVITNETQTVCTYPRNAWTQYEYEYDPDPKIKKSFQQNFNSFISKQLDILDDMLYVTGYINLYKNDFEELIQNSKCTHVPQAVCLKQYTFLLEERICKGKQIASLSWHPMWTGTVACAYSDESANSYTRHQPNKDVVAEAVFGVIPVLLWSFKDTLRPRLYLQPPREVSVVSFCPYDENILIGGCINGQIIIWDIRNRLEEVEIEEPLTTAQQRYRALMDDLVHWMKNIHNPKIVYYTAASELEYSHRSAVTSIRWFSAFREINKSGQIKEIPEQENRKSLEFMTTSKDGTILAWDLLATPTISAGSFRPQRKLRRLKERPQALNKDISPYKSLHRIFKPLFRIHIKEPNTNRSLPISAFSIRKTANQYIEKYPNPQRTFNITDRIYYKPKFNRPTHPLQNTILVGTSEGDFVITGWEGFAYNSGAVVNEEVSKIQNFAKYHDGPIVSVSRMEKFPDIVLTVGGKVFAVWKTDFANKPILWRRCKHKYTFGLWNNFKPSMFRLSRSDGCVEWWHLKTRSDRYQDIDFISGLGVSGTSTHPLPMDQNIVAMADSSGALRLYYVPLNLTQMAEEDAYSTYRICEREAERKKNFLNWQASWIVKHEDWIKEKNEKKILLREKEEDEKRAKREKLEKEQQQYLKAEEIRLAQLQNPLPGQYTEWANRRWLEQEKERMNRVLLSKKALDIRNLEKQQLPLLKEVAAEEKKKKKQLKRLKNSSQIFENTVAMMFPNAIKKHEPPPPDPYAGGDPLDEKLKYFNDYKQMEEQCMQFVDTHKYTQGFDWLEVLKEGKERRKVLDGNYSKYNHKLRLVRERAARRGLTAAFSNFDASESASDPSFLTNSTDS